VLSDSLKAKPRASAYRACVDADSQPVKLWASACRACADAGLVMLEAPAWLSAHDRHALVSAMLLAPEQEPDAGAER